MVKRIFDVIMSSCVLLAFSPVMLVSALLIRFSMGGPVFFRQWRPGRQDISWERKLRLDVEYVDRQSLWLDLRILFATVVIVLKREGILYGAPQGRLDEYRRRQGLRHAT